MKKTKILLITIITLLLTSCYDKKELNKISIMTATEINKINNEYIVNVEISNPKLPNDSQNESPYIIYTGKGKTIQEAYRQIKLSSSRYLYPEHLELLIINENIAQKNINEILDFYLRSPSIRTEFYILIGKDDNILGTNTNLEKLSSTSITNTLETNNKYLGVANLITLNELASDSINPNKEIILPSIEKEDDKYILSGLAIFKNNKLIDYLSQEESITYNILKNNTTSGILTYECEKNKYLTVELIKNKSTIKPYNNKIDITINEDVAINESNCSHKLNNEKDINIIKNELELYLKNRITNDINNIRNNYNTDIFGFLDEIYKHDYQTYIKVKDNWYDHTYKNTEINVNTNINILGKGKLMEGINEKN